MKKNTIILFVTVLTLLSYNLVFGQTFLNGDFESVKGESNDKTKGDCNYNLPNNDFNNMISDCFAFGSASQIDIINDSCEYGPAQHGNYFIALAVDHSNTKIDALSLALSEPLQKGFTYALCFYNRKHEDYDSNILELGYSSDSSSFGNSIGKTSVKISTTWEPVTFSFTPVADSEFITIRTIAGTYGWNLIDNFTIIQVVK